MQFKHTPAATASSFDDPNLVSHAGIIPLMRLADRAGPRKLAQRWLSIPTDKGANAGAKIFALVAGMVAGADSIDDLGVLRHGGMRKLLSRVYAPSTLGSFLRAFTFGHVRQLDAIASRFLTNLSGQAEGLVTAASGELVMVDVDDSIIGSWLPEARRRIRLLRGEGCEHAPRNRIDLTVSTGHRGATLTQRGRTLCQRGCTFHY